MAEAGADLLMLEMTVDIDHMLVMLDAAEKIGLAVWLGLSCKPDEPEVVMLLRGGSLAAALDAITDKSVPLVSIMHTEVEHIDPCLDIVADHWSGPIGVYTHSARWVDDVCYFDVTIPPRATRPKPSPGWSVALRSSADVAA